MSKQATDRRVPSPGRPLPVSLSSSYPHQSCQVLSAGTPGRAQNSSSRGLARHGPPPRPLAVGGGGCGRSSALERNAPAKGTPARRAPAAPGPPPPPAATRAEAAPAAPLPEPSCGHRRPRYKGRDSGPLRPSRGPAGGLRSALPALRPARGGLTEELGHDLGAPAQGDALLPGELQRHGQAHG